MAKSPGFFGGSGMREEDSYVAFRAAELERAVLARYGTKEQFAEGIAQAEMGIYTSTGSAYNVLKGKNVPLSKVVRIAKVLGLDFRDAETCEQYLKVSTFRTLADPEGDPLIARDKDLDEVAESLRQQKNVVIHGLPGVGKSHFLEHFYKKRQQWLKSEKKRFEDGLVRLNVGDIDEASLVEKLAVVYRQLFPRKKSFGTLDEAVTILSRCLAEDRYRLLFLIDDLWSPEFAKHLCRLSVGDPSDKLRRRRLCNVILTTRLPRVANSVDVLGDVVTYRLDTFDAVSARRILNNYVGESNRRNLGDNAQLAQLYERVDGLAIGLKFAGQILRDGDIGGLLQDIDNFIEDKLMLHIPPDATERLKPAMYVLFAKSVDKLSKRTQEAFFELGAVKCSPSSFDEEFLNDQWANLEWASLKEAAAQNAISRQELCHAGLLRKTGDRFQIHSLIVEFIRVHKRYREYFNELPD